MRKIKKIEYIAKIEKLLYIQDTIKSVTPDKVESVILSVRKVDTLSSLMRIFSDMNNHFAEEETLLEEHKETYNKKYATDFNGGFSTAYQILQDIKKSILGLYRVVNVFEKAPRMAYYYSMTDEPKALDYKMNHSVIGSQPCQGYLFKNMNSMQKRVYDEITSFLRYLDQSLKLCIETIKEETEKSEDIEYIMDVLDQQINESYEYVRDHNQKLPSDIDSVLYKLAEYEDNPEAVKTNWHQKKPSEITTVSKIRFNNWCKKYLPIELKTFRHDFKKIDKNRKLIIAIHSLGYKITGEIIVWSIKYLEYTDPISRYNDCFNNVYNHLFNENVGVTASRVRAANSTDTMRNDNTRYFNFSSQVSKYMI